VAREEDAEPYIQRAVADGSDYIKLMHEGGTALGIARGELARPTAAVQAAVVQAAHRRGLKVVAHALSRHETLEVLRAGVDGLAHTFFDAPMTPEVLEAYFRANAWVSPTLAAAGLLTCESKEVMTRFSQDPRITQRASTADVQLMHHCLHLKSADARWEYAIDGARQLKAAGVDIIW
jgi:imidazolonepropionase-like amidohydrolase